ncbi:MAG TPA: hypothetical protein VE863_20645 [Pyrinomonadaceae bacterium]|jgi:hypothetical protein|nr:hypothetical protein [Pyrinomonadaceae bacterium]
MDLTVDGNSSLQDQVITLNQAESQGALELKSYSGDAGDATHTNTGSFDDRDITKPLPPLKLVESAAGHDVWVSGQLKKIAITR